MRKLNYILQDVLKFLLLFLLFFVWLRYFIRNLWLCVLYSLLLTIFFGALFYFIYRKKDIKTKLKMKEKEDAEDMYFTMCMSENPIDFYEKLAKKKHKNIISHSKYLVINHPENVKTILYLDLTFQNLTIARFMEIYSKIKKEKATKIVICCQLVEDKKLSAFLNGFKEKIVVLDMYQTYEKLYKYYDCFPEITKKVKKKKKEVLKEFIAYSFNKKRTKGYLFSAVVLIISGLFIPATIYYCIVASLLVVFAMISQFNPFFNKETSVEIF